MRILILGGGYAGISLAIGLRQSSIEAVLVNRHSYHHLTTLLHQPAVGRRSYRDLSVELADVLPKNVRLVRGRVASIDPANRSAVVRSRNGVESLEADALVVALGWEPRFFDIPGMREHALTLDSLNASRRVKDHIEQALIALDDAPEETWRARVVIGGGGLTGVELAGELSEGRGDLAKAFDLEPADLGITLIESGPALLKGLDPWLSSEVAAHLTASGVECLVNARIQSVDERGVSLGERRIDAGTVLWTGGVKASSLIEKSGFAVGSQGRAEVDGWLRPRGFDGVFVIGDAALALDSRAAPLPMTAQIAVQQGRWLATHLRSLPHGEDPASPFEARIEGIVLSVGRKVAIGVVRGRRIRGLAAAVLKDAIAYRYLFGIGGLRLLLRKLWEWLPYTIALRRP